MARIQARPASARRVLPAAPAPSDNHGMSVASHRAAAPPARVFVLTISDTRTFETDTGGRAAADLLQAAGHTVIDRQIVPDEPVEVAAALRTWAASGRVDAVVTTGGTGITRRDTTYEAVATLFDKRLDGFGELFRMLSYREIGAAAMLSRACAGTVGACVVFVLPGSEAAVRLAMNELILPELGHLVGELNK